MAQAETYTEPQAADEQTTGAMHPPREVLGGAPGGYLTQAEYDRSLIAAWRADCSVMNFQRRIDAHFSELTDCGIERVPQAMTHILHLPVRAWVYYALPKLGECLWKRPPAQDEKIASALTNGGMKARDMRSMGDDRLGRERSELRRQSQRDSMTARVKKEAVNKLFSSHRRSEQWNVCK